VQVFQRPAKAGSAHHDATLTLVGESRTLDLEVAVSADMRVNRHHRDQWVEALRLLVK
jgi:hypothetical protein